MRKQLIKWKCGRNASETKWKWRNFKATKKNVRLIHYHFWYAIGFVHAEWWDSPSRCCCVFFVASFFRSNKVETSKILVRTISTCVDVCDVCFRENFMALNQWQIEIEIASPIATVHDSSKWKWSAHGFGRKVIQDDLQNGLGFFRVCH